MSFEPTQHAMKNKFLISSLQRTAAISIVALPLLVTSCQDLPPSEQMSDAERKAYVEHRKWDLEAENRKQMDAANRR
jgi:hypothetical protein